MTGVLSVINTTYRTHLLKSVVLECSAFVQGVDTTFTGAQITNVARSLCNWTGNTACALIIRHADRNWVVFTDFVMRGRLSLVGCWLSMYNATLWIFDGMLFIFTRLFFRDRVWKPGLEVARQSYIGRHIIEFFINKVLQLIQSKLPLVLDLAYRGLFEDLLNIDDGSTRDHTLLSTKFNRVANGLGFRHHSSSAIGTIYLVLSQRLLVHGILSFGPILRRRENKRFVRKLNWLSLVSRFVLLMLVSDLLLRLIILASRRRSYVRPCRVMTLVSWLIVANHSHHVKIGRVWLLFNSIFGRINSLGSHRISITIAVLIIIWFHSYGWVWSVIHNFLRRYGMHLLLQVLLLLLLHILVLARVCSCLEVTPFRELLREWVHHLILRSIVHRGFMVCVIIIAQLHVQMIRCRMILSIRLNCEAFCGKQRIQIILSSKVPRMHHSLILLLTLLLLLLCHN